LLEREELHGTGREKLFLFGINASSRPFLPVALSTMAFGGIKAVGDPREKFITFDIRTQSSSSSLYRDLARIFGINKILKRP